MKIDPMDLRAEAIGGRLRRARLALDLSQIELCRLCGFAPNAYNQWERGKRRPNLEDAARLCDALGVTLDYIFMGVTDGLPVRLARHLETLR